MSGTSRIPATGIACLVALLALFFRISPGRNLRDHFPLSFAEVPAEGESGIPGEIRADIDADGQLETIAFTYADLAVVPPSAREKCSESSPRERLRVPTIKIYRVPSKQPIWVHHLCDDPGGWNFWPGTGVYSVGDMVPHLITVLGVGPSFGGYLRVWRWHGSGMQLLPLPPDLNRGIGRLETWALGGSPIIFSVWLVNESNPRPPVLLAWTGGRYVDVSSRYPEYYLRRFKVDVQELLSQRMPSDGWMHTAEFNVRLLLLEGKAQEAVTLCNGILKALDDPARNPPPTIPLETAAPIARNIQAIFDQGTRIAKERVGQLLREARSAELSLLKRVAFVGRLRIAARASTPATTITPTRCCS